MEFERRLFPEEQRPLPLDPETLAGMRGEFERTRKYGGFRKKFESLAFALKLIDPGYDLRLSAKERRFTDSRIFLSRKAHKGADVVQFAAWLRALWPEEPPELEEEEEEDWQLIAQAADSSRKRGMEYAREHRCVGPYAARP